MPFNGGAPALLALASGHVQMMFADTLTAGEQAKAGTIRAIGVATPQRSPLMPDVPPISDTVPGFRASSWWGIGAPQGTSGDIVKALNSRDQCRSRRRQDQGKICRDGRAIARRYAG